MNSLFAIISSLAVASASTLPQFNIDPNEVTVSGMSSGAFFANQMHVAFSSLIKGAAIHSGGPYYCSQGSITISLTACMLMPSTIPIDRLIGVTDEWSTTGRIDKTSNLANSPVYLFWGTEDTVVAKGVMDSLDTFYRHYGADVTYNNHVKAPHAFVTAHYGNDCDHSGTPYINNCGYDSAGVFLEKLYGPLHPKREISKMTGTYIEFDQHDFTGPKSFGFDEHGWIYVPKLCKDHTVHCKLHFVFHGCLQGYVDIGDQYVKNAGYNEWADTNDIIMVYPQMGRGATNRCWDWWGDQGDRETFAQKTGNQMSAVKRMIDHIMTGASPQVPTNNATSTTTTIDPLIPIGACYSDHNYGHTKAGRAYHSLGLVYAKGSDDFMGIWNIFDRSKLRLTAPEYYEVDNSC